MVPIRTGRDAIDKAAAQELGSARRGCGRERQLRGNKELERGNDLALLFALTGRIPQQIILHSLNS